MTVKQLRQRLARQPDDAVVVVRNEDAGGYDQLSKVRGRWLAFEADGDASEGMTAESAERRFEREIGSEVAELYLAVVLVPEQT